MIMKNDICKTIGENIAFYRRLNGFSQRLLGNMVGISQSKISDIELGKDNFDLDLFVSIAKALNIEYEKLCESNI